MSLNSAELRQTVAELTANFDLSGLTPDEATSDLGWTEKRLRAALRPDGTGDPVDVWELRDYLEHAVRDAGRESVPFTVLTSRSRVMARMWFSLRKAPRHAFPTPTS